MNGVVFGGGFYGKALKRGLEKYCGVEIDAVIDNDKEKWGMLIDNIPIISPDQLLKMSFDKIFICLMRGYQAVEAQLAEMGISGEKIVIMKMNTEYQDAFMELDPVRRNWIKSFADYTREQSMTGSVAECGVYYGETSMFINKYWADRKLYLFDTFEGFAEKDVASEEENFFAYKNGLFQPDDFKIESSEILIETVKARMLYPENIWIRKGYFPDSAKGIDDKFCFVNLDMDLYQPELEGLRFFWSKMEIGGVILLHDYFEANLPGVKAAVEDFEKEMGRILPKVPIGDNCSLAIIKCG